jgi:hypothetical protein
VIALFVAGYFAVGRAVDPARARELSTALDRKIPFVARTVWIYLAVFPASLFPLFVVRGRALFRRTIAAYAAVIVVSLAAFVLVPVTSVGLREDAARLDLHRFSTWAVATLYRIDPPVNLFPSLHLSIAALASLSAWKASRTFGAAGFAGVAAIAASICTVKQHFIADGAGGLALAGVAYAAILRAHPRAAGGQDAYGPRGAAAFVAFVALLAVGSYVGFRLSS